MKKSAIVRIILFGLLFLILLGFLLAGLAINGFLKYKSAETRWEASYSASTTKPEQSHTPANTAGSVSKIGIKWVSGNIFIQSGDVDQITYQETEVSDPKYKMIVNTSGDGLEIQYCSEVRGFTVFSFGTTIEITKDLIITVPRDTVLKEIDIESASTNVTIQDVTIQEIELKTASGKCKITGCRVGELDIETASGDIDFYGELNKLEFDAASAKFTGVLTNTPKSILVDSMSGDLDVTLPADSGFTVTMTAISGDFTSDFSTTVSNGAYVCGNGTCQIQYNGMYGDIIIRKGE